MLEPALIQQLARQLYEARKTRTQLRHFSKQHPGMTIEDGYAIQRAWVALERADGGRGFGFTGGHTHANWGDPNQRKIVLNAILWLAKMEVPAAGVESALTSEDLLQNLDPKSK